MKTGEPFGWPRGSVRALLTVIVTVVSGLLLVTGQGAAWGWIGVNGFILGLYFGYRSEAPVAEAPPSAPYVEVA